MKYLAVALLCVNYLAINANKLLVLPKVIENGLTEDESDLAMASAILQSEKTRDKSTISESIVSELTDKFGGEWSIMITTYNQYDGNSIAVRFQTKKLLRFVHEKNEFLVVKTEQQTSQEVFAKVLSTAVNATVTRGYIYDANNSLSDVLSLTTEALKLDFRSCTRKNIWWIDAFGECYRLIADNLLTDLLSKYDGRWSVTVGETNSHFQSWSQNLIGSVLPKYYSFVAQFNLGKVHFNILQFKQ